MKRLELAGSKFYRLTVLNYSHSHIQPSGQKRAMWNVICDCGKELQISTANLTSGKNKSCGCYINELRKQGMIKRSPDSEIASHFSKYKTSAKTRNKEFELTFDIFKDLVTKNCFYCDEPPANRYTKVGKIRKIKFNGIDRYNNKKGYTVENSVPCCGLCNRMKGESSVEEFFNKIIRIHKKCQL
jgi:hypothetical protein